MAEIPDPMERLLAAGLAAAGVRYVHDSDGRWLPTPGLLSA